jgi:D-serine deaminase-like pyridoxal phosphate-dependent protein
MLILENLTKLHQQISTPALLIDEQQMIANLRDMQSAADSHGVTLRPHCKTHKSPILAKRQIELGAKGITVAKTAEAELMFSHGIDNIFIANQITHSLKIRRLRKLHEKARIIIGIDHPAQINLLKKEFENYSKPINVRIEIDCGFGRCGLTPANPQLPVLAKTIAKTKWLNLEGLFTHAGQAYSAKSCEEIKAIAKTEANEILKAKDILLKSGIKLASISVGSTPTAKEVINNEGITEVRPGNYIFYDGIQKALRVATSEDCSLLVLATVISQPAKDRIVCDAGSKALNLDKGAHSTSLITYFGEIQNIAGHIERVSEEHGIITLEKEQDVEIGSALLILPNHACTVANLYEQYHLVKQDLSVQTMPISARGMSQ